MNLDEAIRWVRSHETDDDAVAATALQDLVNDAVFKERALREAALAKAWDVGYRAGRTDQHKDTEWRKTKEGSPPLLAVNPWNGK